MKDLTRIELHQDELEALRLCDKEGLTQAEAGIRMAVSRGTVQRLVTSGRHKIATALVECRALLIDLPAEPDQQLPEE
jgi:predicted DNA-binding protein (UPF0251 family)